MKKVFDFGSSGFRQLALAFPLPIVSLSCSSFLDKVIFKININLHILDRKVIQAMKILLQKIVHGTDFMQGRWKVWKCRGEQVCLCPLLLAKSGWRGAIPVPTVLIINVTKNDIFDGSDCTIWFRLVTMTAESSLPFDLTILRSFRVLRPLKLVSKVPSKRALIARIFLKIYTNLW